MTDVAAMGQLGMGNSTGMLTIGTTVEQLAPQAAQSKFQWMNLFTTRATDKVEPSSMSLPRSPTKEALMVCPHSKVHSFEP